MDDEARRRELGDNDAAVEEEIETAFDRIVDEGAQRLVRTWPSMLVTGFFGGIEVGLGVMGFLAVEHATGSNPMAAQTLIPWLTGEYSGTRSVHASLAVLTGDPAVAALLAGLDPATIAPVLDDSADKSGNGTLTLTITAPDGKPLAAGFRFED